MREKLIKNILPNIEDNQRLIYMNNNIAIQYTHGIDNNRDSFSYYVLIGTKENFRKAAQDLNALNIYEARIHYVLGCLNQLKYWPEINKDPKEVCRIADQALDVLNGTGNYDQILLKKEKRYR